jgi:23S rRNA (pseudouridine1915-N3)-methyltransferase
MRLVIAAVGRLKDGGERDLCQRYFERMAPFARQIALGPLEVKELPESRASSVDERKADEAQRLIKAANGADYILCLDEQGRALTSAAFSKVLTTRRDEGTQSLAILIGGPDGHGQGVLDKANLKLCLSAMTLTHGLARVILAEQLYRAATIAAGHPYHRI